MFQVVGFMGSWAVMGLWVLGAEVDGDELRY